MTDFTLSASDSPVLRPVLTDEMLTRLDRPGPRYTSYPTADRFVDDFGARDYLQALHHRHASEAGDRAPLSIYVHIPFCESVCYYCACNKIVTKHHDRAAPYLKALLKEVDLVLEELGPGSRVAQLHLGGGTPTFFSNEELRTLMHKLQACFTFEAGSEVSIEVDPRTVDVGRLQALKDMGFNRLSFGVQDFDEAVQKAVHREQSVEMVRDLLDASRRMGFVSTNLDLIYGLPLQTPESLTRTLDQVIALRPDRIALYAYAHLPARFMPQRRIDAAQLPPPEDRVRMLGIALEKFQAMGYDYIGMDHFALPTDALAQAKRAGRLHRNFQGYSTLPDCDLIGLGVSSIGKVGTVYSQNAKTIEDYEAALDADALPVVRGMTLSADDLLRRDVIMAIMCQGRLDYDAVSREQGIAFESYFARELQDLQDLQAMGLVTLHLKHLEVTDLGWYFVRGVAIVFDKYLQAGAARERYSKMF